MVISLSTSTDSTQHTTSRYPSVHSPGRPIPALNSSSGRCPLSNLPIQLAGATPPNHSPPILPKSTSSVLSRVVIDTPRSVVHPFLVGPGVHRPAPEPGDPPTHRLGPRAVPPHPLFCSRQHVPPVSHAKCAVTSAQATTHPPPRPPDLTPPIPITAPYHLGGPLL